jgi:alkanesulfonate monooxygenase SsuD/methylene tetrahydromethanopterin reductase-like flavin-dependent oxidoreductase (luciferase family)
MSSKCEQVERWRPGGSSDSRPPDRTLYASGAAQLCCHRTRILRRSYGLVGTPEQVAEVFDDYYDLGISHSLIRGFDADRQITPHADGRGIHSKN